MKGYRTNLFNGVAAAVPIIAEMLRFLGTFDWRAYLEPQDAIWVMLIIALANIYLRSITTTPMGRAE